MAVIAILALGAAKAAAPVPANQDQRLALQVIRHLDVTTFRNSIGPRRQTNKHSLADYGFTDLRLSKRGADIYESDGRWMMGFSIILSSPKFINLCWVDRAVGSGTYNTARALAVFPVEDRLWRASDQTNGFPDCPGAPPIVTSPR